MHPALAPPRHQSCPLQGLLHPAVAEFDLMLIAELFMKMPHVQIVIAVAIQPHSLPHHRQWPPLRRRLPTPPITQSVIAELFVTFAPAPNVPVADSDDLRCLPPRDLPRHSPQNHFLYFHRPLHRGLRVREHACHVLLPSPPEKRTDHVLSQPDISCANDTLCASVLPAGRFGARIRRSKV